MHAVERHLKHGVRRSLVLAGGGMRLAYQAGVLIALEEEKIQFDHVDGTSGGIFNAAMLASGLGAHDIAARWRKLDIKHFMSLRPLKRYFKPLKMTGYADAEGIRNHIFPALGIDITKINTYQGPATTFNVCNFSDKTVEAIEHKKVTEDHLIAGVSLPILMPGIKIQGKWYSDAVWIKDANLIEAVRRGAEELWLVWAIGNTATYLPGALNQYVHMIEMSANGGLLEEYERIAMINDQIKHGSGPYGQSSPVTLQVVKPKYPLPLDPDLYFKKIDARSLINMGYAQAKKSLANIPEYGIPMDPEATKMCDPGIRLNMRGSHHGILKNENAKHVTDFFTYLVFSQHPAEDELQLFASIQIKGLVDEIPCYENIVKITRDQMDDFHLEGRCLFNIEHITYTLVAEWVLNAPFDIMLGLEFKSVKLSVFHQDDQEPILSGRLYQSINQRLKSLYTTNVRRQDGTSGGLSQKYSMTSKIFNYAI